MAASGPSKSAQERREAQREVLRKQRQAELSRQRTVRTIVIAVVTVIALALLSLGGVYIYRAMQPAGPVAVPEGMSEDQPYLSFGAPEESGKPVLEIHLDFICPVCGQFEQINGEDLQTIVDNEEATVHIVPRRFLDARSTTGDYSSRAASAFAAVYEQDPGAAWRFQQLLFENQPAEGTAGLTDEQLWSFAQEAGADESAKAAVDGKTYVPWVRQVAEPYGADKASGTPYVEIDGTQLEDWSAPGALRETVLEAGGSSASDAGGASDGGES